RAREEPAMKFQQPADRCGAESDRLAPAPPAPAQVEIALAPGQGSGFGRQRNCMRQRRPCELRA
ncbi:MAG TPA: hypothetical protein VK988_07015, partial [Acidimicrobiales bacterium]|nr:hypothetical protein [Acidimicrobiales bacterium]